MFEIDQIFVPVDFSRSARAALHLARTLPGAAPHATPRLQLAHVIEPMPPAVHAALFPYAAMGEDLSDFEQEMMAHTEAELARTFELEESGQETLECEVGEVREVLPEMLLRSSSSMVVMGAFGQGGAMPEALGSTAARMLRACSCPVLLARDMDLKPRIRRILCAVDLTPQSTHVLEVALSLAIGLKADFVPLFVLPDPLTHDAHNLLSHYLKYSPELLLARERQKIEALFERTFKSVEIPYPHREHCAQLWRQRKAVAGPIARTIVEQAHATDSDLVILGTRDLHSTHSSQLGRTCWEVTRHAITHTLVVPAIQESTLLNPEE